MPELHCMSGIYCFVVSMTSSQQAVLQLNKKLHSHNTLELSYRLGQKRRKEPDAATAEEKL